MRGRPPTSVGEPAPWRPEDARGVLPSLEPRTCAPARFHALVLHVLRILGLCHTAAAL